MSARTPNLAFLELVGTRAGAQVVTQEPTTLQLSPREQELTKKMVCLLIANGETIEETARKLTMSPNEVYAITSDERWADVIVRMQSDSSPTPQERVKKMTSIALDVQTRLLLNPSTPPAVRAKVAQDVSDRGMGKAVQSLEIKSLHFDLKDAVAVDRALKASHEKLQRIEDLKKRLSLPVGRIDV